MWLRHLLFASVLGGGLLFLGTSMFPPVVPQRVAHFNPKEFKTDDFRGVVRDIDTLFEEEWADLKLEPAPRAPELIVARRLSLALSGSIPSLQEVRQFEAQSLDERLQWWLSGIFADRRHADYLAERFARVYVGTENGPFIVYRRRRFVHWLSDQFMANRPYDAIVRDLIASVGLWTDQPATNFITVTIQQEPDRGPNPNVLAGKVARGLLGIRLDCAECHNHPFKPWKQSEFQGLAAYFSQVQSGFTGIYDGSGEYEVENRKTGVVERIPPGLPDLPDGTQGATLLPSKGNRRQKLAAWVTHPKNPYFARATVNRVWAVMFNKPLLDPVDDLPDRDALPKELRRHFDVIQRLADDFVTHQFDMHRLIRVIAATRVFQLDSAAEHELTEAHDLAWAAFPMTRLRPEQVVGSVLQAASLGTINSDAPILTRLTFFAKEKEFVNRYGDTGDDEYNSGAATIPQRLLLMNGDIVLEKTRQEWVNASTRIANYAPNDQVAVEVAYLAALSRRPTPEEAAHFEGRLAGTKGQERLQRMEDLYWTLFNSTEFSWNH